MEKLILRDLGMSIEEISSTSWNKLLNKHTRFIQEIEIRSLKIKISETHRLIKYKLKRALKTINKYKGEKI